MRHLKEQPFPFELTPEQRSEIIGHLFPTTKDAWQRGHVVTEGVTPFSKAKLDEAADHIKTGKAPGPDHIPPEVVKIVKNRHDFAIEDTDLKIFIGSLIFSGYRTLPSEHHYWSEEDLRAPGTRSVSRQFSSKRQ
nr:unnamed protein product [Callosobruchus chinensis]